MDIQGALKAGYSHDEIIERLAQRNNMNLKGALDAGYKKSQILLKLIEKDKARTAGEQQGLGSKIAGGIKESLDERGQRVNRYAQRQFSPTAPTREIAGRKYVDPSIKDFINKMYIEAPVKTGAMYAGQVIGGAGDIIGETIGQTIGSVMPQSVKDFASEKMQNILQSDWGTTALQKYSQGKEVYDEWAKKNPDSADELNSLTSILGVTGLKKFSDITGVSLLGKKGWNKVTEPFKGPFSQQKKNIIKQEADDLIDKNIMKGIKPTAQKKKSFQFIERSEKNYRSAVKSILKRQDDLPETVLEMSEALSDTKRQIWDEVKNISGEASAQGFMVDTKPIIKKMQKMAKSFYNVNPNEEARLLELARRWKTGRGWETLTPDGKVTIEEAERMISNFNSSSSSFFNELNPNSIKSSVNDAGIANALREEVFNTIPDSKKYKALRKEYGDILNIEKEVTHRAIVAGRQNAKGFFDLADVWGTGDFVSGLATLNPASIAKGIAVKGSAQMAKNMNNADRYIKKMFKGADKKLVKAGELDPRNRYITRRNSGVDMTGENLRDETLALPAPSGRPDVLPSNREAMELQAPGQRQATNYRDYKKMTKAQELMIRQLERAGTPEAQATIQRLLESWKQ